MFISSGQDEPFRSPKKAYFSHIIGLNFLSFFYEHPVDHKIWFLAFFEAKMTKIVILKQKLIVLNDYQLFCICICFELFYHFFKSWM